MGLVIPVQALSATRGVCACMACGRSWRRTKSQGRRTGRSGFRDVRAAGVDARHVVAVRSRSWVGCICVWWPSLRAVAQCICGFKNRAISYARRDITRLARTHGTRAHVELALTAVPVVSSELRACRVPAFNHQRRAGLRCRRAGGGAGAAAAWCSRIFARSLSFALS